MKRNCWPRNPRDLSRNEEEGDTIHLAVIVLGYTTLWRDYFGGPTPSEGWWREGIIPRRPNNQA